MPLLERTRVEVYLPDLPAAEYQNLFVSFQKEFTYTFGGCSTIKGLEGNYLSRAGDQIADRINVIYVDMPLGLSTNLDSVTRYVLELRHAALQTLREEDVLLVVGQVYHVL